MFESIILGAVQGLTEWLPISSEGMIVLVKTNFFGGGSLEDIIRTALFLHLGTFLAALIYFRKDVSNLFSRLFGKNKGEAETGKILKFLIIATLVSGVIGFGFLKLLDAVGDQFLLTSTLVNLFVALLLVITGVLQLKAKKEGQKNASELKTSDGITLGIVQGFSAMPGLSRSGLTVSALLLKNFKDNESLRLSFLMSLPIVLAGNILLNLNQSLLSLNNLAALFTSFVFGYLTIHLLIRLAKKINFGYFVLVFAGLLILSVFI
ncbi:MAG: undecaprenyl-diphosphate phosphatase [Candidatus Paceibacterota bacterium]